MVHLPVACLPRCGVGGCWWVGLGYARAVLPRWGGSCFGRIELILRAPARRGVVSCVGCLRAFGCVGAMLTFTESLILAQHERWRRA